MTIVKSNDLQMNNVLMQPVADEYVLNQSVADEYVLNQSVEDDYCQKQ